MNYKFKPNDKVLIMSYVGAEQGVEVIVYTVYTSDKENHSATPHNRYVCYEEIAKGDYTFMYLHDVSENELQKA